MKMLPWNSASILLSQQVNDSIQFGVGYYYQGRTKILNTTRQSRMQSLDMRLAKSFARFGNVGGGEVALVLQNVF